MIFDLTDNFFKFFGLAESFTLDLPRLDEAYRNVQSEVHPDRFAAASAADKRRSMQLSTYANEAYRTLKQPLSRARYLVQLNGVDTQEETNTAMPKAFLVQQMEWRERIEESDDVASLDALADELREAQRGLIDQVAREIDLARDFAAAANTVRKLRFLEKLGEEIADAQAQLESV